MVCLQYSTSPMHEKLFFSTLYVSVVLVCTQLSETKALFLNAAYFSRSLPSHSQTAADTQSAKIAVRSRFIRSDSVTWTPGVFQGDSLGFLRCLLPLAVSQCCVASKTAFSPLPKKALSSPLLEERFQMRFTEHLVINTCLMLLFQPAFSWQLFVSFPHSTATEVILLIICKVSNVELWHCACVCMYCWFVYLWHVSAKRQIFFVVDRWFEIMWFANGKNLYNLIILIMDSHHAQGGELDLCAFWFTLIHSHYFTHWRC